MEGFQIFGFTIMEPIFAQILVKIVFINCIKGVLVGVANILHLIF